MAVREASSGRGFPGAARPSTRTEASAGPLREAEGGDRGSSGPCRNSGSGRRAPVAFGAVPPSRSARPPVRGSDAEDDAGGRGGRHPSMGRRRVRTSPSAGSDRKEPEVAARGLGARLFRTRGESSESATVVRGERVTASFRSRSLLIVAAVGPGPADEVPRAPGVARSPMMDEGSPRGGVTDSGGRSGSEIEAGPPCPWGRVVRPFFFRSLVPGIREPGLTSSDLFLLVLQGRVASGIPTGGVGERGAPARRGESRRQGRPRCGRSPPTPRMGLQPTGPPASGPAVLRPAAGPVPTTGFLGTALQSLKMFHVEHFFFSLAAESGRSRARRRLPDGSGRGSLPIPASPASAPLPDPPDAVLVEGDEGQGAMRGKAEDLPVPLDPSTAVGGAPVPPEVLLEDDEPRRSDRPVRRRRAQRPPSPSRPTEAPRKNPDVVDAPEPVAGSFSAPTSSSPSPGLRGGSWKRQFFESVSGRKAPEDSSGSRSAGGVGG